MAKIKHRVAIQEDPCLICFWADPGIAAQVFDIDGIVALHAGLVPGQWIAFYSPQYDRDDIEREIREIVEIAPGEWETAGDVPAAGVEFDPALSAARKVQGAVTVMSSVSLVWSAIAKHLALNEPERHPWYEVKSQIDLKVGWHCLCPERGAVAFREIPMTDAVMGQCVRCGRVYVGTK